MEGALQNLAVIPLLDADHAKITLAWSADGEHPLVDALVGLAAGAYIRNQTDTRGSEARCLGGPSLASTSGALQCIGHRLTL